MRQGLIAANNRKRSAPQRVAIKVRQKTLDVIRLALKLGQRGDEKEGGKKKEEKKNINIKSNNPHPNIYLKYYIISKNI